MATTVTYDRTSVQSRAVAIRADRRLKEEAADLSAIETKLAEQDAAEDARVREADESGHAAVAKLFANVKAQTVIEFMDVRITVNCAHREGAMRDIALEGMSRLNRYLTAVIRDMAVKAFNMGKAGGTPTASGHAWIDRLLSDEGMLRPAYVRGLVTIEVSGKPYPSADASAKPTTAPRRTR
jgi:hypothetical protein